MNKQIDELVEWVGNGIDVSMCASCGKVGDDCDGKACVFQKGYEIAKQILSYPDLALIDREKEHQDNIWNNSVRQQLVAKHNWYGQGMFDTYMDLVVEGDYKPVIPLAEELKEDKAGS